MPEDSIQQARPWPRSLPLRFGAARRAAKPARRHGQPLSRIARTRRCRRRRDRRLVREAVGRDEVAPPDLDRIEARHPRRLVDQPLEDVDAFRPAGAAIGVDGLGVGEDGRTRMWMAGVRYWPENMSA
jgi:hypothetical protein